MEANDNVVIEEESLFAVMRTELGKIGRHRERDTTRCTIHRVLYDIRPTEDSPYDPKVISIGPLHRDKERLKPMEKRKWRYLHNLLQSSGGGDDNDDVLREYIEAARSKEEEARACYYKPEKLVDISSNAFVNMLVLDGCFLIKFIIDSQFTKEKVMDDLGWKLSWVKHDILLLENQIPFFVLEALFEVYRRHVNAKTRGTMLSTAIHYLCHNELWDRKRNFWTYYDNWEQQMVQSPSHLLHLYHMTLINSHLPKQPISCIRLLRRSIMFFFSSSADLVFWPMYLIHRMLFGNPTYPTNIASATELQEAGVKLQASFMDLRFGDGTLFIPIFSLDRQSFSLLKNLIALEIYHPGMQPYILTYSEFLGELIKTPADMEVMQENHIITAQSNEEGAQLVSNLLAGLDLEVEDKLIPMEDFVYWQHPGDRKGRLMKYCEQPHHRWRARLIKDYFGNPWAITGFLVAFLFLVLTILQTVYALLAYYHDLFEDADSQ